MKKNVNYRVYDTDTAQFIAKADHDNEKNAAGESLKQSLYRKKTGEFFVSANFPGQTLKAILPEKHRFSDIYPLTYAQALQWMDQEMTKAAKDKVLNVPGDDEDKTVVLSISMPAADANKIRKAAAAADKSLSNYINERMINMLDTKEEIIEVIKALSIARSNEILELEKSELCDTTNVQKKIAADEGGIEVCTLLLNKLEAE